MRITKLLWAVIVLALSTSSVYAIIANPWCEDNPAAVSGRETLDKDMLPNLALSVDGPVDFDLAQTTGANYLQGMQADITEDNAGNGNPDNPDDPDDGGWDWSSKIFRHSTSASPTNIYGTTALGLYYTYLEAGGAGYKTALTDAANRMATTAGIRSGSDLIFLMLYNDLPGVGGSAYRDSAKSKYDSRIAAYGSAQALAQYIRDVRGVTQGYPNGIIAWDIGVWARAAAMLDTRYPGNGYGADADAIAEVIYQDSYMDNPGYFDIVDDAGWDPTYSNVNYYWYNLGITGLIDAFAAANVHTDKIPNLVSILLDGQALHGGISYCYGANAGDDDWQSTAYAMMTLGRLDQATYQPEINKMGYYLAATQDPSGAWIYSSGSHYPEIGGECLAGLYYTTNTEVYDLADVVVDDDFAWQGDVDLYNAAHGTNYIWGYDAFATVQEGIDAVSGSTIHIEPGTYVEQLYITVNDLVIEGSGVDATIIQSPAALTHYFTTGSNKNYPVVFIDGASNVTITALTVDGNLQGNTNSRFDGIGFWNGGGSVEDVKIINVMNNPFSGAQHGVAVYSYNDTGGPYTIAMTDVVIYDFQKNAVALLGAGLTVALDNVTATGEGPTSVTAQNGIQIGPGVTGTVANCVISDIAYTGATWTATGFLNEGNIDVTGLQIDGCQTSVYWIDGSGTFTGGTISSPVGDAFYAYNSTTTKQGDLRVVPSVFDAELGEHAAKTVQNVTLSNSTITGTGATDSWGIGAFSTSTDPVNLTVNGCTIDNWDYGVYAYDYGGPVNCAINGNAVINCPHGMTASAALTDQNAIGNWWGSADAATVAGLMDGPVVYSPWWSTNYLHDPHTSPWVWYANNTGAIQAAINAASAGDTIYLMAGTYAEGPQITVNKDLTIIGETAKSLVTITPVGNTGSSGDSRGWILVPDGIVFNFSHVTLDGAGYNIHQAIRCKGGGVYSTIDFKNIVYPGYNGVAIAIFPSAPQNSTIDGCTFTNIGRVGALLFGGALTNSFFTNNIYTGKGDGDWLDYAADISAGAVITAEGNSISGCTGVASSDGSTSAGLLVTTYYGAGTTANLIGNTISGCSAGLAIGYDGSDVSKVVITGGNVFLNNEYGISTTASAGIDLTCYGNTFSNTYNADDDAGGTWDNGSGTGNCWTDFGSNAGYPSYYLVGGDAGAIDHYPSTDCGIDVTPDNILYHCDGNFTFAVGIGDAVTKLEAGSIVFVYDADLVVVDAVSSNAAVTIGGHRVESGTTHDTLYVDFLIAAGWLDGPADLFTVEMSGATSYCAGTQIVPFSALLFNSDNELIPVTLPAGVALVSDCEDPDFTLNGPAPGGYYKVAPVLNIQASDDCDIDAVFYQIDGCASGAWTAIVGPGYAGSTWSNAAWSLPGFAGLSDGEHCVRFKVRDDNGRGNADSCSYSWCFWKDVTAPVAPSNFTAEPGHNKVKLNWSASPSPDVVGYRIQRVAWGNYPLYDTPAPSYPANQGLGTTVFDGIGVSHIDTYSLSNATRDIYYYAIFAYDAAGNFSLGHVGSHARSTSYWLGDIANSLTTFGAYDGYVNQGDLYHLGFTYWLGDSDPDFEPEIDWGPTADGNTHGIPTPDDTINVYDLAIFAINYGTVNPTMKAVPLWAEGRVNGNLNLSLDAVASAPAGTYALSLNNARGDVKIVHSVVTCGAGTRLDGYQVVANGQSDYQVFGRAHQVSQSVEFDFALLGNGLSIAGSGELVRFTFTAADGAPAEVAISEALAFDNSNEELGIELRNGSKSGDGLPQVYALSQNYPNPFNPTTQIDYQVPHAARVTIEVINVIGQRVAMLVDRYHEPGCYSAVWSGTDDNGQSVSSGIYFYRLRAEDVTLSRKMMLVK